MDVSSTLPPWQNVVGPPAVIVGAGLLFTVTVTGTEVPVHPKELVVVTMYTPELPIVVLCVIGPWLHELPLVSLDMIITFPPWQNVVGPLAVITGDGAGFTVTLIVFDVSVQPLASVTAVE